jgi:OOP family OmpA-OmpF porin
MRIFKILVLAAFAMSLSACAIMSGGDIESAAALKPKGGKFEQTLHKEYIKLAWAENKEGDHPDAIYFANKARAAASGKAPKPDTRKQREISKKAWGSMKGALTRFKTMQETGGMEADPVNMAKAQAAWDCWMQEQEENLQPKDIKACKNAFNKAMGKVAKAKLARLMMKPQSSLIIYFDFNSAAITKQAEGTLNRAAAMAGREKSIMLNAHTDTAGNAAYNKALSARRAAAAAAYLKDKGVAKVSTSASGENAPAVATGDGKKEAQNRRVEITIK